jgi:hypothetical protein
MDCTQYLKVSDLDGEGKCEDAYRLLLKLAAGRDPLALLELSSRNFSTNGYTPPVFALPPDIEKSKSLAREGEQVLLDLAAKQDGEAMRILGNLYLGHFSPHHKSYETAKDWLHKSFDAGCHFAANDLSVFYSGIDMEKAKYWRQQAVQHGCCVIGPWQSEG